LAPPKSGAMKALAQLTSHIPNKGEQMVRFYAYYSSKSRGLLKKSMLKIKLAFVTTIASGSD
jgi:hypothetical protein